MIPDNLLLQNTHLKWSVHYAGTQVQVLPITQDESCFYVIDEGIVTRVEARYVGIVGVIRSAVIL